MGTKKLLFGYVKMNALPGSPASSVRLYEEGTLIFCACGGTGRTDRQVTFRVTPDCIHLVTEAIREKYAVLSECALHINEGHGCFDGENYFIFGDLRIIDWDLTRLYLEEDRKKHPEYYKNSVKVQLTETYVRDIFDEICGIIERDEKEMRGGRALILDL